MVLVRVQKGTQISCIFVVRVWMEIGGRGVDILVLVNLPARGMSATQTFG